MLFFIFSCSNNKVVYWCGDHACINKKEREAYFKKTLIVEVKNINNDNSKNDSNVKKIQEQLLTNDKERKVLEKEAKINKKKEIQKQKELEKQSKSEKKKEILKEKKMPSKLNEDEIVDKKTDKFSQILKRITGKNNTKPFPDINDIQN